MLETAAAQAIGNTVAPTVEAGKGIFNYLDRNYRYVKNLSSNFAELEREEIYLNDREHDVRRILNNNAGTMEGTRESATWLDEVKEMKDKIQQLKARYQGKSRWLCGMCPFPSLRKLSKDIVRKKEEVIALKDRMRLQNAIMIDRLPQPPESPIPVITKHPTKKIDRVQSIHEHVETLLKWLRDSSLKKICIWGLPGVGKTTLMEILSNKVRETQLFDIVFWVRVSKGETIRKIQDVIMNRLELQAKGVYDTDQIASVISMALENKRYLLLLDEVFSEIDLKEVGIHNGHEHGKVVFASRYRDICRAADEEINIKRMSEDDALKLFREIAGDIIDHQQFKWVSKMILKECGGMPHMIKLIAQNLKRETNLAIWRNTLSKLRSPSSNPMQEIEEFYKAFKLVYDKLHVDEQPCLLYCAYFPPDYEINQDHLIECWRAEQFITCSERLGDARDTGHATLKVFLEKSLIERGRKLGHFKMPVFFRRMALKITFPNETSNKILVGEGEEEEEEPEEQEWECTKRVSLISHKLHTLPERPGCCTISTLLLQKNGSLTTIPESFFGYMCGLKVLDLYDTRITSLPSSIFSLENLRVLYLNNCSQLMELPNQIEELKSLEILDIRGTGINTLPAEIGKLIGLRCMRVSFLQNSMTDNHVQGQQGVLIPSNIISKLSLLEELSIDVDPRNHGWNQIVDEIAREVASLRVLTTLCFCFPRVGCFETFIQNSKSWKKSNMSGGGNFRSFRFIVGSHGANIPHGSYVFGYSSERHLRFSVGEGIPVAVPEVLNQTSTFELIGHRSAKNLSEFGTTELAGIETCLIQDCNEMESIIDGNMTTGVEFEFLQKLHIINLVKLVCIWDGSIRAKSLTTLTTLILKGCPKLKKLFSHTQGMVQQLCKLQYLQVEDCCEMEMIIEAGSISESGILPCLRKVELRNLPKLSSICDGVLLDWPSLETIQIKMCQDLNNLPFSMDNATKLRLVECKVNWWNNLVWPDDAVKVRIENLGRFI